jgi:hypothetical protein
MEVLMDNKLIAGAMLAFLGWLGVSIMDLKTDTAVIAVKVDKNHEILSVLWGDYLEKRNGNLARLDVKTNQ